MLCNTRVIVSLFSATLFASTIAAPATAALVGSYTVGSGSNASFLQFEFTNTNTYLYEVRYDGALFGDDLLTVVAAAQPTFFAYEVTSYSFGDALTGVTIGADHDAGFGTPPDYLDYWHYWTRETTSASWTESWVGFADRAVSDGSWDGWVFNSAGAPRAVPAPGVSAIIAVAAFGRRRRR